MGPRKGFKITDADRKSRVGIAVETYDDLTRKTIEKFKIGLPAAELSFQTRDGALITNDAEFQQLSPQTLLIWVQKGDRAETDAEILYKTIREVNLDFLTTGEKVQEFFTDHMKDKVFKLAEVLKGFEDDKAKLSNKEDDLEWFEGVESRSKTKEEYMFRRAQDRIRTYYYKTKDDLQKKNHLPQNLLSHLFTQLQKDLKSVQFFGCYFDRRHNVGDNAIKSICDETGTFDCQGKWDKNGCLSAEKHAINPYRSREDRIVFQTWNLDHRIERSRAIMPAICSALENLANDGQAKFTIDTDLIFNDLFTLNNLKLVHIACHDKKLHAEADFSRYIKYC